MTNSVGSPLRAAAAQLFDMACISQLRQLAKLDGLVMAAAVDTPTGDALHSIRRPTDIDLLAMCKNMAELVRGQAAARIDATDSVQSVTMHTRHHAHILRQLRRAQRVALYVVVENGDGKVTRARLAVLEAAFVLETLPAVT